MSEFFVLLLWICSAERREEVERDRAEKRLVVKLQVKVQVKDLDVAALRLNVALARVRNALINLILMILT